MDVYQFRLASRWLSYCVSGNQFKYFRHVHTPANRKKHYRVGQVRCRSQPVLLRQTERRKRWNSMESFLSYVSSFIFPFLFCVGLYPEHPTARCRSPINWYCSSKHLMKACQPAHLCSCCMFLSVSFF